MKISLPLLGMLAKLKAVLAIPLFIPCVSVIILFNIAAKCVLPALLDMLAAHLKIHKTTQPFCAHL